MNDIIFKLNSLENLIGHTPLVEISFIYKEKKMKVYAKLEYYNLTGSIKDRAAYYIITKAKERGELKDGMPIIEATSGNTGISLSALGARYKHPVYIFMPDWASAERVKLMQGYGANVILIYKGGNVYAGYKNCTLRTTETKKNQTL